MQKSCWYCHRPLSLFKSFKGELFCDSEHEKLYLSEQFKRVQEPFAPKTPLPKAEPEPPPPQPVAVAPVAAPVAEPVVNPDTEPEPVAERIEPVWEPAPVPEPVAQAPVEVALPETAPPEPVAVAPVAVEPPVPSVEPSRVRPDNRDVEADPPAAPLFPWPVNACQGTWQTPVPDAAVDLVPQRINASRTEPVALKTTLQAATAVVAPVISAQDGTHRAPVPEETVAVLPTLLKPRMGENARLAVAREDFPTATSVATPVRVSGGAPPKIVPEAPESLKPARIDPRVFDQSQGRAELEYGSASSLQLRASHPAVASHAIHQGLPAGFSETPLSKQVPRMLSLGVAPQPERTPALSSRLNPVVSSETDSSVASANALPSQIEVRIPDAAVRDANTKSSAPAAGIIEKDLRAPDRFKSSLPLKNAAPSQIAVRIPNAALPADWKLNWTSTTGTLVTALRIDQKETDHVSLESLVETSLQLTLISMATLGNVGVDRETAALLRAAFLDAVRVEPSQYRGANATPESAIAAKPPMPLKRFAGGFAAARPSLADSYAAVAEVSTCADSRFAASQPISVHPAVARAATQLEFADSLAAVSDLSELSVAHRGPVESPWKSARNVTPGAIKAAESTAISVAALQLPPALSGTVAFAVGTWKYPELSIAASTASDLLTASAQIARSLDSRRPESAGDLADAALRTRPVGTGLVGTGLVGTGLVGTGLVGTETLALRLSSIDGIVPAFHALGQIQRVSQTGLPAASVLLGHVALSVSSTLAISSGIPSVSNAPEFSHSQQPRRVISASLLGLPAARATDRATNPALSPVRGAASEIAVGRANSSALPGFESALPLTVPAANKIAATSFQTSTPALSESPAILTVAPIASDVPSSATLAQPRPRRHSPASLLVLPGVQMAKRPERFAAEPEVPAVTLS